MKFFQASLFCAVVASAVLGQTHVIRERTPEQHRALQRRSVHKFNLKNNCPNPVTPVVADTSCGYSPRCADAAHFTAPQPRELAPKGDSQTVDIPSKWVGRVFAHAPQCGPKGESCTMTEFNLDANDMYAPNSYDISNIQGFTQSIQIIGNGCPTVTCTSPSCSCNDAYPLGDMSGCGNDKPVKACGAGDIEFTIVFCP